MTRSSGEQWQGTGQEAEKGNAEHGSLVFLPPPHFLCDHGHWFLTDTPTDEPHPPTNNSQSASGRLALTGSLGALSSALVVKMAPDRIPIIMCFLISSFWTSNFRLWLHHWLWVESQVILTIATWTGGSNSLIQGLVKPPGDSLDFCKINIYCKGGLCRDGSPCTCEVHRRMFKQQCLRPEQERLPKTALILSQAQIYNFLEIPQLRL